VVAGGDLGGIEAHTQAEDSDAAPAGRDHDSAEAAAMRHEAIRRYLHALGRLCAEVAAEPKLLPTFLQILTLVPRTVGELAKSPCK
jgi:hypothetical protein